MVSHLWFWSRSLLWELDLNTQLTSWHFYVGHLQRKVKIALPIFLPNLSLSPNTLFSQMRLQLIQLLKPLARSSLTNPVLPITLIHSFLSINSYHRFSLFVVDICYKVFGNSDLVNTEPLLLGKMLLGSGKLLFTTFLLSLLNNQYILCAFVFKGRSP